MIITSASLDALRVAFRLDYNRGFQGYKPMWDKIATLIPSDTGENRYGWIRDWPRLREWFGDRVIKSVGEGDYTVINRNFEATVGVKANSIKDDVLGIYKPMMEGLGVSAAEFPDEIVFALLAAGFDSPCWDNQNFFDTDHPVGNGVVSNVQAGQGAPWVLMDTSQPLKPLIYQERQKPNFVALVKPDDDNVFMRNEYLYGVDLRSNAGFGFWQMAFGSMAPLTADNYAAAREAMTSQQSDNGRKLNIRPDTIVVGPSNRAAAKQLFGASLIIGGGTNIYFEDVKILETPYLQ